MLSLKKLAALTMLAAATGPLAIAAPPLATVRDTIYKADGSRFNGKVIIEWRSFEASDTSFIGRNRLELQVTDGFLNARLVPTTTAAGPAYYTVRYVSPSGTVEFIEAWAVKPSDTTLRVRDIRIADPLLGPGQAGGLTEPVEISDVNGLQGELDIRPKKGATYTVNRIPLIGEDGDLEAIAGDPDDCVHVDGTAGPCSTTINSYLTGTFVDGEVPAGAVNGSNAAFTLAQSPNPVASLLVYRNGLLQKHTLDYSLTGSTITFLTGALPQTGDVLLASYRTTGTSGTIPQILCAGNGSTTSLTTSTSLGTCTIPASLLQAGDRVEINADWAHAGATTAYSIEIRWGATTLLDHSAGASSAAASARASAGVYASGAQWSVLALGNNLAPAADAGNAGDDLAAAITVDLRARMAAATTDTVALRSFTVMRIQKP